MDYDTDMVGLWISIWARIRAWSMIRCPLGIVLGGTLHRHAGDAGLMSRVLGLLTLWWSDGIGGRMGFGLIIGIWTGTWILQVLAYALGYGLECVLHYSVVYYLGHGLGWGLRYGTTIGTRIRVG
jgi:hypothetical protein